MSGKKLLAVLVLLASCGQEAYQDEVTRRRLIGWIDDRQYQRVVSFMNTEATDRERHNYGDLLAEAHMGMGGFDVPQILSNMCSEQVYRRAAFAAMSNGCPGGALRVKDLRHVETRCLLVRLFNSLPDPAAIDLTTARDLWRSIQAEHSGFLPESEQTTALLLETVMFVSQAGTILADYYDNESLDTKGAIALRLQIKTLAIDAQEWIQSYRASSNIVNAQLMGNEKAQLFKKDLDSKLEFAAKTGIPEFLKVADISDDGVEDDSVRAKVFRGEVINELDHVLSDYFKVNMKQEP